MPFTRCIGLVLGLGFAWTKFEYRHPLESYLQLAGSHNSFKPLNPMFMGSEDSKLDHLFNLNLKFGCGCFGFNQIITLNSIVKRVATGCFEPPRNLVKRLSGYCSFAGSCFDQGQF